MFRYSVGGILTKPFVPIGVGWNGAGHKRNVTERDDFEYVGRVPLPMHCCLTDVAGGPCDRLLLPVSPFLL
jgi:hypothetical protein